MCYKNTDIVSHIYGMKDPEEFESDIDLLGYWGMQYNYHEGIRTKFSNVLGHYTTGKAKMREIIARYRTNKEIALINYQRAR